MEQAESTEEIQRTTPTIFVTITPEMEKAGIEELRNALGTGDFQLVVRNIYEAMAYMRLDSLGLLRPFADDALKIHKGQG